MSTAPELSPAEAARVAAFDAAPTPPEVVEADRLARVTEALLITVLGTDDGDMLVGCELPVDEIARLIVEHGAAAAIAALPPSPAEEALRQLVDVLDGITVGRKPAELEAAIAAGRAALASPAPARQGEEGQR